MRSDFNNAPLFAVARRWHRDERGMLTLVNTIAVLLCCLMITLVLNVSAIVQRKVRLQNSADAVARTGAVWQARAMNSLTATNHVVGEMLGLVIVHHAVGGDKLDLGEIGNSRRPDNRLDRAYDAARPLYGRDQLPAYPTVREEGGVPAEATLLDAKIVLKDVLTWVYWNKVAAWYMQHSGIPPVVAAGKALETAMHLLELAVLEEYLVLDALQDIAIALAPLKLAVRDVMLPFAKQQADAIVEAAPEIAAAAAERIAAANGTQGLLYPINPPLPVERDPHWNLSTPLPAALVAPFPPVPAPVPPGGGVSNLELTEGDAPWQFPPVDASNFDPAPFERAPCNCPSVSADDLRQQIVKTSQLARATFPWVNYHRQPLLDALAALCPISRAAKFYKDYTDGYSKELCDQLQTDWHQLWLYTLKEGAPPDRGFERWTLPQHSDIADRLFTVVGVAYLPPPPVLGLTFGQSHPEGLVCYSQAMLYNANEQERPERRIDLDCKRIVPLLQANAGWDTLNWEPGSDPANFGCAAGDRPPVRSSFENRPFELIGKHTTHHYPTIQVNWQARLSPGSSTRLRALATADLPAPFGAAVRRLDPDLPSTLRTH